MYTAIVFLPLLGFLISGLFGRQMGARPAELGPDDLADAGLEIGPQRRPILVNAPRFPWNGRLS